MQEKVNVYLKGKYGRLGRVLERDSGTLYAYGKRKVKRKEDNLPDGFVEVRCKCFWYMDGYVNTKGVKYVKVHVFHMNHFHKDDDLYVSFDKPIAINKIDTSFGMSYEEYTNYDYRIDGGDIETVLDAIEKNSPEVDLSEVAKVLMKKMKYLEKEHPEALPTDYKELKKKYRRWMKKQ